MQGNAGKEGKIAFEIKLGSRPLPRKSLKTCNAGYFVLIDPEQCEVEKCAKLAREVERAGADAILLGGSFLTNDLDPIAKTLKQETELPVVLFPGDSMHLTPPTQTRFSILA